MITETCQRFTEGRESKRPAGELIRASAYDAVASADPAATVAFIEKHHYAKSCSSRSHLFELYKRGELVGAAAFGALPSMNAHRFVFPTLNTKRGVTLGRFVLNESVEGNGESWFVARCFELLANRGVVGVESCADLLRGHCGTIYQATNGRHVGLTNRSTRYMFPDKTELSNRSASKLTGGERGADRAVEQLYQHGADWPVPGEDVTEWLRRWRRRLCHSVRHPGNFRYLWCLDRRQRREVLARFPEKPYPKLRDYQ